jgi:hypothetical protein
MFSRAIDAIYYLEYNQGIQRLLASDNAGRHATFFSRVIRISICIVLIFTRIGDIVTLFRPPSRLWSILPSLPVLISQSERSKFLSEDVYLGQMYVSRYKFQPFSLLTTMMIVWDEVPIDFTSLPHSSFSILSSYALNNTRIELFRDQEMLCTRCRRRHDISRSSLLFICGTLGLHLTHRSTTRGPIDPFHIFYLHAYGDFSMAQL